MLPVVIRIAAQGDLTGLLDLYRHLNPDDPRPDTGKAETAWAAMLGSGLISVFIAESGRTLASSCTLSVLPNLTRNVSPYGVIENVVTHPQYRRNGFGRAILAAALEAAWSAGCYKVMLATGSRNLETLRFYEGAGFERGGKTFFQARRKPVRTE